MVAHLITLKVVLLRNGLRRSVGQLVGLIIGALYGLGVLALAISGLIALRLADADLARTILVVAGSALVAGWALAPIVVSGVDLTLDPARFALFPIPLPKLLLGQAAAGLIGIPGACTALALAATTVTWARGPAPFAAAALSAVVALALCVVISRLVASAATELATSRRFREASRLILMVPLMLLGPIIAFAARGIETYVTVFKAVAGVLGWTPLGAAFAAPASFAAGDAPEGFAQLAVAAASLALSAWVWSRALARALVTPASRASSKSLPAARRGLGAFGWMPQTPAGAIAARSLTYWIRDPRYGAALILVPLIPVLLFFSSVQRHNSEVFLLSGPIAAFLLAWSLSTDVSYDSTAFSLHLVAGVRGREDRWGRALALMTFALPAALVITLVPFIVTGRWDLLPGYLGLALGVLLSGAGLASTVSARFTVAVPLPGESPFKRSPGNRMQTLLVQLGGMIGLGILVVPEIVLVVLSAVTGAAGFGWAALGVGLGLGGALFVGGILLGGAWLERRGPEVYASLVRAG
ncbi:transporter [Sinomonas sp. ASV322]|uniref:transporter n=1 Tax=Sinomonas sp. ASV322 TaxID=3041920 RepID=UPI0027DDEEC9|nr:transporter [Sinomonas sp. ASV322]MDQ4502075.1 transporter [Sinomonas sp. ASV322]